MKLRRIARADQAALCPQVLVQDTWQDSPHSLTSPFHPDWERARAQQVGEQERQLPFQPLSFRDFMLYEQHVIDSARGYARRFLPAAFRVATLYERLRRRPFPMYRPKPLWYRQPTYYMSNHLTFVPSGTPVRAPSYTRALDYELELGFVLARPLHNASPAEAEAAIGGFVVLNDFSARDVQVAEMRSGLGPQKAKHFLNSMSEVLVSADEVLPRVHALTGAVLINGAQVASVSSAGMRYSLGEVLAHASRDEQLFPGELFGTGTLPGGSGMENGHWLQAGDRLRLVIEGVGEIEHLILA